VSERDEETERRRDEVKKYAFNGAHRPWPAPRTPWSVAMVWHDLLFAHWPVEAAALRPLIPGPLEIDEFDGRAWVGVVPFRMSGIRHRLLPPLPGTSAFPELNVRTYVRYLGRGGVYFFSLDARSRLAVMTARARFHLNYQWARMSCERREDWVHYHCERRGAPESAAHFVGRYRASGPAFASESGALAHWLTERYSLLVETPSGRVGVGEIDHSPWPLQPAEAEIERNTMAKAAGIELPDEPPVLHFAERLEVRAWGLAVE
jgi:uncharacterized protein YqjF (DUF2071 family)